MLIKGALPDLYMFYTSFYLHASCRCYMLYLFEYIYKYTCMYVYIYI